MKKKIVSIALLTCMVVTLLAGCGNNGGTSTETESSATSSPEASAASYKKAGGAGEVVVGIAADPENMGPWSGMSQGRIAVLYSVYEYILTRVGGVAYGVLAKDWKQVDDKTYQVELYDYIHDTAGNELTASDIVFSFETAIATNNYSKLQPVESVKEIDDYKVEFVFSKKLEMGEFENIMLECAIVTQAAYEASPDQMATNPVGTTAYAVTSYVPGSSLVLEDTGNYWQTDEYLVHGTSLHNIPKITFTVITEASQMTVALQTNSIDVSNGIPDTDVPKFSEGGEYADGNSVSRVYDNLTYNIEYNMSSDSVFENDLNLRLAIAYAIDKEGLNQGAFNGNGKAVKDFANANYPDYVKEWDNQDYYDYNLDKAKQYMEASDYDGSTLRIMYISSSVMDTVAQMVQAYLGQIGIQAELSGYDSMMFQSAQYDSASYDILLKNNGSTDYIVNQWKLCWDARDFQSVTGGTANFVQDDKLQTLMETALSINTYGEDSLKAFHDYLVEKCYGYGLVQGTINIVHSNYLTDVALDSRKQIIPGACTFAE